MGSDKRVYYYDEDGDLFYHDDGDYSYYATGGYDLRRFGTAYVLDPFFDPFPRQYISDDSLVDMSGDLINL